MMLCEDIDNENYAAKNLSTFVQRPETESLGVHNIQFSKPQFPDEQKYEQKCCL